jgi:hypothetical protein
VDISESDYLTLEASPVDKTPETGDLPLPINIISDEIEPATEEELQRIIEEEGQLTEPEIGNFELDPTPTYRGREDVIASYSSMYPTHFDFRADVARLVNRIQRRLPWQTFANTYYMHPPVYGRRYEFVSVDFWGGGLSNGRYVGYRGKPIGTSLGQQVWNALWNDPYLPNIFWIIWRGRMWVRGSGWENAPGGPPDSDAGHYQHVHVTYV